MKPQMPKAGDNTLNGIYRTVKQIVDYLPSLEVAGDNLTTTVDVHSSGRIVRAKPQKGSGASASAAGSTYVYDGPWSFTTTVNNQNQTIFQVKGGYFNRNGLFVPMNVYTLDSLRYYDFNLNQIITDNYLYYVHIYQEWVQSSKAWRAAEVRVTHDAPPQSIPLSFDGIYGYCLLGWLRRSGDAESGYAYNWESYNTPVPTMFVAGECRTGEA